MGKLIAVNQIMYKGKQYLPGEELPADDIELVQAWKRAGSVKELPEENTEAVCDVARDSENSASGDDEVHSEENAEVDEAKTEEVSVQEPVKEGKRKK